jgi:peptide/nickel transport system ATP-binding protein
MELSPTIPLYEDPLHPYAQDLLESVPDVTQPDKKLTWIPGAPPDLINPIPGCMYNPRCKHVMDICKTVQPDLIETESERLVACHLFGGQ